MAKTIQITDADRVSYRVRILASGAPVTTVYVDDYDAACDWAYTELAFYNLDEPRKLWAAVIEEGVRFEGLGTEKTLFAYNGRLRDGLVLDKSLLGTVDRNFLFGLT